MCQSKNTFILCTCSNSNKSEINGDILNDYTWSLNRFIGLKETSMKGKIVGPTNDLGNQLNLDDILKDLNSKNIFDFDYQPSEKDCLTLSSNDNNQFNYFKVLYKDGAWIKGRNPAFITISKEIANGKVIRQQIIKNQK